VRDARLVDSRSLNVKKECVVATSMKCDECISITTEYQAFNKSRSQKVNAPRAGSSVNARQAPRIVIVPRLTSLLVLRFLSSVPAGRVHVFVENVICVTQPRPFVSGRGTTYPRQPDAFTIQSNRSIRGFVTVCDPQGTE